MEFEAEAGFAKTLREQARQSSGGALSVPVDARFKVAFRLR
jgi:hypothetical protein